MGVTNEGLNHVLDVQFHGTTPVTTWYLGLINNASFTGLSPADTLASHPGWLEVTSYTGGRPAWTEGAASSQATTNPATIDFAITATLTAYGLLLASAASGSSGVLFCTAAFSGGSQAVVNGDTLKVTLTINAASG